MANGDDAAAAGLDTVPGSADRRNGYDEINKTRDYVARHQTSGTHPASAITSGTLPIARGGTGAGTAATARTALDIRAVNVPTNGSNVQADIDALAGSRDSQSTQIGNLNAALGNKQDKGQTTTGSLDTDGSARALYNRNNPITTSYVAAYIDYRGVFGPPASTRASKQDFSVPEISIAQLRQIEWTMFRYIEAVQLEAEGGPAAHHMLGVIADDLHAAGLWQFVRYEGRGPDAVPAGVHMELFGLAGLRLAQDAHDRLDALERQVATLIEGSN